MEIIFLFIDFQEAAPRSLLTVEDYWGRKRDHRLADLLYLWVRGGGGSLHPHCSVRAGGWTLSCPVGSIVSVHPRTSLIQGEFEIPLSEVTTDFHQPEMTHTVEGFRQITGMWYQLDRIEGWKHSAVPTSCLPVPSETGNRHRSLSFAQPSQLIVLYALREVFCRLDSILAASILLGASPIQDDLGHGHSRTQRSQKKHWEGPISSLASDWLSPGYTPENLACQTQAPDEARSAERHLPPYSMGPSWPAWCSCHGMSP